MSKKQVTRAIAVAREKAIQLRKLRSRVASVGKRGLIDTFALGEALEEASVLLRGKFSAWLVSECNIEPRTALGFRKTFLALGDRKDWLVERGVAPSVAVMIASAQPEGRERVLSAIASGRRVTVAAAKMIIRGGDLDQRTAPTEGEMTSEGASRSRSGAGEALGPVGTAVVSPPPSGIRSVSSTFRHGLTAFEICAGGGGQAAGLAKAGFNHVGMLEREAKPCETLRAAFGPDHVIEADVVGYVPKDVGPVDLLAGGVPCQPFSQAGRRKGRHDKRDCFPEALRLVGELKPRAVMLENVPGLMGPANDLYRFGILSKLSKMGYEAEWRVVHCTHFGVPQDRKRAILVAFRDPEAMARFRWPAPVGNYVAEPNTMASALASVIRARGYEPPADLEERLNRTSPTVIGGSPNKASPDLGQPKSRKVWEDIGYVVTKWGEHAPGHDHVGPLMPTNKMIAALQGFPADWPFKGSKRDVYRQIANAFPPVVAMHLGCAIATALTGTEHRPRDQQRYEGRRWVITPESLRRKRGPIVESRPAERVSSENRIDLPLARLRAESSIGERESSAGDVHDIDYAVLSAKFGPWPADMWEHQRQYGRL